MTEITQKSTHNQIYSASTSQARVFSLTRTRRTESYFFLETTQDQVVLPRVLEPNSMTQLLSHTIAHITGPSFMLKANNQSYKKSLGLVFSSVAFS